MSGTGDDDETDLFDDDLDTLSEAALQELEYNALLCTQQATAESRPRQLQQHQHVQRPLALPPHVQAQAFAAHAPQSLNPAPHDHLIDPQFEDDSFEFVGEDGVPTPIEEPGTESFFPLALPISEAAQRERFRQHRYGGMGNPHAYDGRPEPGARPNQHQSHGNKDVASGRFGKAEPVPDAMMLDEPPATKPMDLGGDVPDVILTRLQELDRERDQLTRELRTAQDMVLMQRGEISIIRANLDKDAKIHDRQLGVIKKSMEEDAAKHRAQLDALNLKNQTLAAEYQFLQQEYKQELQETNSLKQRLKDRPHSEKNAAGPAATPKRGMAGSIRDGFDDDQVMLASPVRSGRRSKPNTPTAANKRKRKVDVSPIKPLVLRAPGNVPDNVAPPQAAPPPVDDDAVKVVRKDLQAERNLRFVQQIIDYQTKRSKERLIEALMKYSLPSSTSTFSAILLERIARLSGKRLPGDVLQVILDLWSRCLKEKYYEPVELLIEATTYILECDLVMADESLLATLLPVLTTSAALNAKVRFQHSPVTHAAFGTFRQTPQSALNTLVPGTPCLRLLLNVAYTISDEPPLIELFWRLMDTDFVLMMLNAWQPISDITLMLHLLATSTFESTFGNITPADQQGTMENYIVNRVCYLLWETPKVDEGLEPYTPSDLCFLRLEAMDLLMKVGIASSPHPHDGRSHHGTKLLAEHPTAIARLVRSLYDEVSAMYLLSPTHALHAQLANRGITLLFHILQHPEHSKAINLQEKLSAVNGGVHKHRVVLTRLAFSDGVSVDRLISEDAVAMATALLEESVTPDEADELVACFPGWKGRRSAEAADERALHEAEMADY